MIKKLLLIFALSLTLFANEYEEWLKAQESEYKSFIEKEDQEFMQMLKQDWEFYQTLTNKPLYKKEKPKEIPVVKEAIKLDKELVKKSKKVEIKKIQIKKEKPKEYKKVQIDFSKKVITFDFYSEKISLNIDKKIKFKLLNISKDNISDFWEMMSSSDYKSLISQINTYSKNLALNDWAKYLFINSLSKEIFNYKPLQVLFSWFILSKMDYDVRIGFSKSDVYLLANISHSLYQISFFNLDKKRYYVLDEKGRTGSIGRIYTYKGNYKNSLNTFSLYQEKVLNLKESLLTKKFKFDFENKNHTINVSFNKNLVDFYKTFPQSDYKIYLSSDVSTSLNSSVLLGLKEIIKDKSELEAVNMILRFVQKSLQYKTDQEQFGYEKVFFPEESFYYPYADCEDRSILFSYLVKSLLGLKSVVVKYDDHLSVAVNFSTDVNGDKFVYKMDNFVMADPTYINANVGKSMPKYKDKKFKIIE
jgi:hypothetical protein